MYPLRVRQEKANILDKYFGYTLTSLAFISCLAAAGPALADHPAPPRSEEAIAQLAAKAEEAETLSHRVASLAARYQQASARESAAALSFHSQLKAALEARVALLQGLIEPTPGEVLRLALPAPIRAKIPEDLRYLVEVQTELVGELQVYHVDSETPENNRFHYFLTDAFGDRIELFFSGEPTNLQSGTPIRGRGALMNAAQAGPFGQPDGQLAVSNWEEDTLLLEDGGNGGATTAAAAAPPILENTFGEQRSLVILVNFQDDPQEPWTPETVQQHVFTDASDYFYEVSFQQTWLSGDVTDWVTIPLDTSVCDITSLAELADAAAEADQHDLSLYSRFLYFFPELPCGWSGAASIGGTPSKTWINGVMDLRVTGHEIGHNLGLYHASGLECGEAVLSDDCINREYADPLDIMGQRVSHFNPFHKERLGWLTANDITTVVDGGSYSLTPYETTPDGTNRALKIQRSVDAATGARSWYYLEFRQPIGVDSWFLGNSNFDSGIIVRLGNESDPGSSDFLDMTPNSQSTKDWFDGALEAGQSYSDADAGITIATDWVDPAGASVSVTLATAPCVAADPQLSATPAESPWVAPGTPVVYSVTVTNQDSSACQTASFDLSSNAPAGWTATFDAASLTLDPGASASADLTVTSPTSAIDGYYDIDAVATNAAASTHSGSHQVTYVVSAPVNQAPNALDDGASTDEDTSVVIPILANDSDPDGDALVITAVVESGNGTCTENGDGSLTYTPAPGFNGTDVFTYSISDGKGGSASASVTVQVAAVNDAPIAIADSAATGKATPVTLDLLSNDSDPDGDSLSLASVGQAANGSVVDNGDGSVTYTPVNGFTGDDGFAYTVSDGNGGSAGAEVAVTVSGPNTPPVAVDDTAVAEGGTTLEVDVLSNDSDPDQDPLTVASITQGSKGKVSISAEGLVVYQPNPKARGSDSFSYSVSDGEDSATALVTVTLKKGGGSNGSGNGKGKGKP